MAIANTMLAALGLYAALGAIFAVAFAARGAQRIDPVARGAPLGFKLLLLPASAALWPLLLVMWLRALRSAPVTSAERES